MNQSLHASLLRQLVELGFTDLEARAYVGLVQLGPATAYQLSQRIRKPTANVYKAVQSLVDKGAAAIQPGKSRLLSALPPEEYLGRLQRDFQANIEKAGKNLAELEKPAASGQLYSLEHLDAVRERARSMLKRAKKIAVVDAFPQWLDLLAPDIERACKRRVKVYVQCYSAAKLRATQVVRSSHAEQVLAKWPCEFLVMSMDSREVLYAVCQAKLTGVIQGYWSNSLLLSCFQHAGMMRELFFHQADALQGADALGKLRKLLRDHPTFYNCPAPGQTDFHQLIQSLHHSSP